MFGLIPLADVFTLSVIDADVLAQKNYIKTPRRYIFYD